MRSISLQNTINTNVLTSLNSNVRPPEYNTSCSLSDTAIITIIRSTVFSEVIYCIFNGMDHFRGFKSQMDQNGEIVFVTKFFIVYQAKYV